MFELYACVVITVLIFGLVFYQNYAEKRRSRRMMRLIKRRRAKPVKPPLRDRPEAL